MCNFTIAHRSATRNPKVALDVGAVTYPRPVATFALIHGAGDAGWYWHLVETELRARGHDTVAPDLPCDDDTAGLPEYADAVVAAIGDRTDVVVVGQSLGGFTAPIVAERVPTRLIVLVAAMIPQPGESPAESETRLAEPSPLRAWPDIPTRVLACRDDRMFPLPYLRRVSEQRLGIASDEIDGGHTPALSRPRELADRLEAYASEVGG